MLSKYLKEKRLSLGMTQKQCADRIGYETSQFISNWERGVSTPPLSVLGIVCRVYGLDSNKVKKFLVKEYVSKIERVL